MKVPSCQRGSFSIPGLRGVTSVPRATTATARPVSLLAPVKKRHSPTCGMAFGSHWPGQRVGATHSGRREATSRRRHRTAARGRGAQGLQCRYTAWRPALRQAAPRALPGPPPLRPPLRRALPLSPGLGWGVSRESHLKARALAPGTRWLWKVFACRLPDGVSGTRHWIWAHPSSCLGCSHPGDQPGVS